MKPEGEGTKRRGRPRSGRAVDRSLPRDEEILKIAGQILFAYGRNGTTLEEIAREAGIVPNSLYYYFESRQRLYERLIDSVMTVVRETVAPPDEASPEAQLAAIAYQGIELVVRNPVELGILNRHIVHMPGAIGEQARSSLREACLRIRDAIVAGQTLGTIAPGDPSLLAAMAVSSIASLSDWLATADRADVSYDMGLDLDPVEVQSEAMLQSAVLFVLAGIGVRDPAAAVRQLPPRPQP